MYFSLPAPLILLLFNLLPVRSQSSIPLTPPQLFSFNTSSSLSSTFFSISPSSNPTFISISLCSAAEPPNRRTTLFVSNSSEILFPDHDSHLPAQQKLIIKDGGTSFKFDKSEEGVYIGVSTVDAGEWEIGVTSDENVGFLHDVREPSFVWEDSDATNALIRRADNFTGDNPPDEMLRPPLILPTGVIPEFLGSSVCAVRRLVEKNNGGDGNWTMFLGSENRTAFGGARRVEWYGTQLTTGQNFTFWEFQTSGSEGAIKLNGPSYFTTKRSSSCFLPPPNHPLLDICPQLTYSIPAPINLPAGTTLQSFFEPTLTSSLTNFNLTLSTYPCDRKSISEGTYSFISTCDDCFASYRRWLCSVVLPRCTDLPTGTSSNFNSSEFIPSDTISVYPRTDPATSRTPFFAPDKLPTIATSPFPYGEVLPCDSTCNMVGATCPPLFGWECPIQGITQEAGYGRFQTVFTTDADGSKGTEENVGGSMGNALRGSDRWGNVFCNAMGTDLILASQIGAARILAPSVILTTFFSLILLFSLS